MCSLKHPKGVCRDLISEQGRVHIEQLYGQEILPPQRHTAVPSQWPGDCAEALPIILAHPWSGEVGYFTQLLSDIAEPPAPGFGEMEPCWNCSPFLSFDPAKHPAAGLLLESCRRAWKEAITEVTRNHDAKHAKRQARKVTKRVRPIQ